MKASGDRGPKATSESDASAAVAAAPGRTTLVQLLPAEHAPPAPGASPAAREPAVLPSAPHDFLRTAFGPPVRGGSAEGLLDEVPGGGAGGGQVQRLARSGGAADTEQRSDAPASVEQEEDFKPATGTKETPLKGTYGDFKVKHGLAKVPSKGELGEYSVEIEMKPNKATGASKIGFMQTVRSANAPGSAWHTKGTDPGMTAERAKRTDPKTGWRVDRADPSSDKTPFYGMYKDDKGKVNQYSTARVGTFGGDSARLEDAPSVADPRTREFVATAKDMSDGKEFGAVHWGFAFDSASKTSTEVTPALLDAGAAEIKGRDAAVEKWNTAVATDGSGIDKVPGT